MTTAAHIGERVHLLRSERDWTQEQLAERAGLHRRTVQDVERGTTRPRLSTCIRIANALDVPLSVIVRKTKEGDAA
jgi:transcriptional regulator with XRE-family HTH domain